MIQLSLLDIEYWKPVPGYGDRYEASNLGRIRRVKGKGAERYPKLLTTHPASGGYWSVQFLYGGRIHRMGVHQVIALAFIGPRPDNMEVNHIDLNKANNRPDNLEYLTHAENIKHARAHGAWDKNGIRGERAAKAKLTEAGVRRIKQQLAQGYPQRAIAKESGVSQVCIAHINTGKTWSHIK